MKTSPTTPEEDEGSLSKNDATPIQIARVTSRSTRQTQKHDKQEAQNIAGFGGAAIIRLSASRLARHYALA
jgi:hypothetical protein